MRTLTLLVLATLVGCGGMTQKQREESIKSAGELAYEGAYKVAFDESIKQGKTEEEAALVAGVAGTAAQKKAEEVTDKALPPAAPEGGGFLAFLGAILPIIAQIGLSALGKKGVQS